jgi:hypothetical protein
MYQKSDLKVNTILKKNFIFLEFSLNPLHLLGVQQKIFFQKNAIFSKNKIFIFENNGFLLKMRLLKRY